MSALIIALLASIGSSTWVYTKLQSKTGYGNTTSALQGTAVVFIISFIIIFTLAHMLLRH